ncbi:IS30 family transposase [Phycicoccus badiiscoriae]|uniref:IS30 family transposase n=2 Tax=Pedococcus badiiscoriae TaxID=642776 RepID=A0A852WC94_9MICO|nr:IS30 family transposase [Pedococcus badiiscoriae]NYG06907.1 IS30 family transposase [Pedococcus badiiscoriae]
MAAAAREVGVSRSAANIWKNGTTVRRKDGTVKIVPPLEPLSLRPLSPRFLSEQERIQIADLASRGAGPTEIGKQLGRSPSTISRELRRNEHGSGQYRPFHAHSIAATRRRRPKPLKLSLNPQLRSYVTARLKERWSPQQISRALRGVHPDDPAMRIATGSIYLAIYRPGSGLLRKPDTSPLRTGRDHRRAHTRMIRAGRRFAQPMLSIHDRDFGPADRSVAGHWEGDLILGPHNRSAIGTLVERQTRYVKLLHLPAHTSAGLHEAVVRSFGHLPPGLRRSITWDQGTEMAKHLDIANDTGAKVYFCDAASPWQRGSNENTNGLLRQYFPKSTNLAVHSPGDLARVAHELNRRPRMTLGDRAPEDLFDRLLLSQNPPPLR